MTLIPTRKLLSIGAIPKHRRSAVDWLKRQGIRIHEVQSEGGTRFDVNLSDLPEDVRLAWWHRELDRLHVEPGEYDDAAHAAFWQSSERARARARAERKAAIATMLRALRSRGVKQSERFALVREKFGDKGTSNPSLKRLSKAVEGVDPINFAPALLDNYRPTKARAELSEDAWRFFLTVIRDAAPEQGGRPMTISNNQLKLFWVAVRKLELGDDLVRSALVRSALVQIAGVTSSKDLDGDGFEAMMGFFEYLGFTPLTKRGPNYGDRPGMASFAQIELIRDLWHEYTRGKAGEDELNKWLERCWKVSSPRFLRKASAAKVITALNAALPHRREHRPGRPRRIDTDPELRAFLFARIDRMTFPEMAAAVAAAFPPERRVGKSATHDWWHSRKRDR